ncbi:MAG: hypothetical protein GF401_04755, partial [Chitinivibrionales bacterium]|nr:hypothetical protein [Chitinivibrionales bacterium]
MGVKALGIAKKRCGVFIACYSLVSLLGVGPAFSYVGTGGYDAPYFQADFYQDLGDYTSGLVNPALLYRVNQIHFDAGFYRWALGHW